jgi:predicted MFS family arabinose efflux permease
VLAGATATAGCLGVAAASTPVVFVAAVFVGGMGAGFASPAMVRVIDAVVPDGAAATAQSMVNTGTAVGVIGAGVLAFATTSTAPAWVAMATVCAACAGAVLLLVGWRAEVSAPVAVDATPSAYVGEGWVPLVAPGAAALVAGAGSALIWTFGPLLATQDGPVGAGRVGWLWIALGLGGLAGPLTGVVVDRLGPGRGWRIFSGVLATANVALAAAVAVGASWAAFAAMALFGAGYMCLSGVLILWAARVWPAAAGAGTAVLFIALAVGQALGSAGFGAVQALVGPTGAAVAAAVLCATGGALTRVPRPNPAPREGCVELHTRP